MDNPSTTPTGSGPASASLPGTQDRAAGRGDAGQASAGLPRPGAGTAGDAERLAKQGAAEIGREARDLKDSARQGASEAAGKVKEAAGQTAQQVKQQAGQLASQFREKGAALFDQQKVRAADLIGDCVAATRRAAQKLHDENDHNLAGYADAFAEGLDSTGRYLREQDSRKLIDDAADLARRRPEWVLGGAFVVGLAVARFLKASRPEGAAYGSYRYDRPQEYGGDESTDFGGSYGGAGYGLGYSSGYGGGYASGGGVREYAPPMSGAAGAGGDAFGERPDAGASNLSGSSPGTLDAPSITTTATGSWAATGGSGTGGAGIGTTGAGTGIGTTGTGGSAPAGSGPDPTLPRPTGTAGGNNPDPSLRDNLGGPLT